MMLCIDPGLRGCGVAGFLGGRLLFAAYVKNPEQTLRGPDAWRQMANAVWDKADRGPGVMPVQLRIERMSVSKGRDGQGQTGGLAKINDLLELNGVVGALAATFNVPTVGLAPHEWKSNIDADVLTTRIKEKLAQAEQAFVQPCAASLAHNVYDAIGIGLWALGRLHTKVIAR